jgi:hypothetical protein
VESGQAVSNGGENNVWLGDQSGDRRAHLIQRGWTDDYELRTFAMDPSGQVLIAASTTSMQVAEQGVFHRQRGLTSIGWRGRQADYATNMTWTQRGCSSGVELSNA